MAEATIEQEVIEFILQRKFFYGYFLQQFKRHITRDVKTLAVNITEDLKPNLYINPDFYNSLTLEEKMAVLEHELLHLLNKHLIRIEGRNSYVWNVATDVAINQYIKGLPYGELCPDCNIVIHKVGNTLPKECPKCKKSFKS
jgi:predicted metal-dependent peptidase